MKVWTNLSHPNIVALLGHTTDPGAPALISPFYKNGCVLEYLEKCASADRYHIVKAIISHSFWNVDLTRASSVRI